MDSAAACERFDIWAAPERPLRSEGPAAPVAAALRPASLSDDRIRDEWEELVGHASEPNAFAEPWFVGAGLRHLAAGQDIRLLEVRRGATLIGLLPLCIAPRYGRMPVPHVENWLHYHSFLGTPLVRAGHEEAFWFAALDLLDREPWARSFLHINGLAEHGPVHRGLAAAAQAAGRRCDTVYRFERALLSSPLGARDYYEATIRKKKRKELARLRNRLAELGKVEARSLAHVGEVGPWCDEFLALERSGWKGRNGSALASRPDHEAFFREAVAQAHAAGRLDLLRLDLDGRAIAMLVNFLTPPGSRSFKIAFDEDYARFSPGVLVQIENLRLLDRPGIAWMDSCAVADHAMINSLWPARRPIVRVSVPLAGVGRQAAFRLCRAAEDLSAAVRRRLSGRKAAIQPGSDDDD